MTITRLPRFLHGLLPLHKRLILAIAARAPDRFDRVKRLLDKGAHPDGKHPDRPCARGFVPALHRACFEADLPLVELLLQRGADPNRPDGIGLGRAPLRMWFAGVDDWLSQWWPHHPEKIMEQTLEVGRALSRAGGVLDAETQIYVKGLPHLRGLEDRVLAPSRAQAQYDTLNQQTPATDSCVASASGRRL